ncbi:hypothetical protein OG592_37570 [Streptomyces avidinii]|uniref:hypothetical protein n=1 Tax=Streptomyces avidinii TaxID=1895 RepID=UPI00386A6541|nr:hypothetical protein OG592_37570 [Streptomyces avidinii]
MACGGPPGERTPATQGGGPTAPEGGIERERAYLHAAAEAADPTDLSRVPATPRSLEATRLAVRQGQSALDRAKAADADPDTIARLSRGLKETRERLRAMEREVRAVDKEIEDARHQLRKERIAQRGRPAQPTEPAAPEMVERVAAMLRVQVEAIREGAERSAHLIAKRGYDRQLDATPASADGHATADIFTLIENDGALQLGAEGTRYVEVDADGKPRGRKAELHSHIRAEYPDTPVTPMITVSVKVEAETEGVITVKTVERIIGIGSLVVQKDGRERQQRVGWEGRVEGPRPDGESAVANG